MWVMRSFMALLRQIAARPRRLVLYVAGCAALGVVEYWLQSRQIGQCARSWPPDRCFEQYRSWSDVLKNVVGGAIVFSPVLIRGLDPRDILPERQSKVPFAPPTGKWVRWVDLAFKAGLGSSLLFFAGVVVLASAPSFSSTGMTVVIVLFSVDCLVAIASFALLVYWRFRVAPGDRDSGQAQ